MINWSHLTIFSKLKIIKLTIWGGSEGLSRGLYGSSSISGEEGSSPSSISSIFLPDQTFKKICSNYFWTLIFFDFFNFWLSIRFYFRVRYKQNIVHIHIKKVSNIIPKVISFYWSKAICNNFSLLFRSFQTI